MERKAFATEFKVSSDGRTVEGYASTFGNVDLVGDIVVAGAYKRTLNNNMGRIKVLRDHEHPIGVPVEAFEDSKGLYTRSRISDTQLGNETLTLLRDGVLDRMSIGYEPVAKEFGQHEGKQVRFLKEIKLFEWSIVTFPANDAAVVTGLKRAAPDVVEAIRQLRAAIALHERHMSGAAPTTGPAGERSQRTMMDQMEAALAALGGAAGMGKALEDLDRAFHDFKAGRLTAHDLAALCAKAAAPEPAPLDAPAAQPPALDPDTSDSAAVIADIRALMGDIKHSIRRAA